MFRFGVSNWLIQFENGKEIYLDKVQSEKSCFYCNGEYQIKITNANILYNLVENVRKGDKISKIIQEIAYFEEDAMTASNKKKMSFTYPKGKIQYIEIEADMNNFANMDMVIVNK